MKPESPRRIWAARTALAALSIISVWLAVAPAVAGSKVVLATAGGSPDWLLGVFRFAGAGVLAGADAGWAYYLPLMAAAALWAVVVWLAPLIGSRWLFGVTMALIGIFFLAPPLLSQDVFSYIAYARLDHVHELNPYAHRPFDIPGDPVFGFAGSKDAVDVYGPLFTIISLPLGAVSVGAAFWILKFVAAASVAALVVLVRRIAVKIGADEARAIAILGLSPATLVHVVAGAHNEALTMLIVFAGIAVWLARADGSREPAGGFIATLAIGVKASAAIPLPFMLAAARSKAKVFAAMVGAGVFTLLHALIGFGGDAVNSLNLLSSNQDRSSRWSLPHKVVDGLGQIFGSIDRAGATDVVRGIFVLALFVVVAYLLRRSWKQPETWPANAGWATLAVLLASAWLVPWYLLWLLPFTAIARDRNLTIASIVFAAYTLVIAIPF